MLLLDTKHTVPVQEAYPTMSDIIKFRPIIKGTLTSQHLQPGDEVHEACFAASGWLYITAFNVEVKACILVFNTKLLRGPRNNDA